MTQLSHQENWNKEQFGKAIEKGPLDLILKWGLGFGVIHYLFHCAVSLNELPFTEAFFSVKGLLNLGTGLLMGAAVGAIFWWDAKRTIKKVGEKELGDP